jgi:hypothetical protein
MDAETAGKAPDGLWAEGRRYAEENGAGLVGTLLLHGVAVLLIVFWAMRPAVTHMSAKNVPFVPVDLVRLGMETASPPTERKALVPQERPSPPRQAASPRSETLSPVARRATPEDALDAKLRALARLKQPDTKLKVAEGQGVSNVDASNGVPSDRATYSLRDYVLAQVLRRWTLDLGKAHGRTFVIPIRVTMTRNGTISAAEIVEQSRAKTDALYRDIAISARNAVQLSSPIALPPGDYPKEMHFTLDLDPRAVVR